MTFGTDLVKRRVEDWSLLVVRMKANCETTSFRCLWVTFYRACNYSHHLIALTYVVFMSIKKMKIPQVV